MLSRRSAEVLTVEWLETPTAEPEATIQPPRPGERLPRYIGP